MYYRWLERASLAGLRLLVERATGNSVMCDMTVAMCSQKTLYSCNDSAARPNFGPPSQKKPIRSRRPSLP